MTDYNKLSENTKMKYIQILEIYNTIRKQSGEFAPYLAKEYFIQNTLIECCDKKIERANSRLIVYHALHYEPKLIAEFPLEFKRFK